MRNYRFGQRSREVLSTVRPVTQELANGAMKIANQRKLYCPDFGLSDGLRTTIHQRELYRKGRVFDNGKWIITNPDDIVTNCDGHLVKSPHQSGLALDFYAYIDGKANYEPANMALIATCWFEQASNMGIDIDWGGSFRSMSDAPHVEIII